MTKVKWRSIPQSSTFLIRIPYSISNVSGGLCAVKTAILWTLNQMPVAKFQTVLLWRRCHIHNLAGSLLNFKEMLFRISRESVLISVVGKYQDDFEPFLVFLQMNNVVCNHLTKSWFTSQSEKLHVCFRWWDKRQESMLYPHEDFSFFSRRDFLMTDKTTSLPLQIFLCHSESTLSSVSFANIIPQHG